VRTPPYRIETERLVLRCWDPADAPLLKDAVESSLDHLRPWMPWAPEEPEELDAVVERLRDFRAAFDRDENWIMGVFPYGEERVLGGTGLHRRVGEGGLEIGYWLRVDAVGNGYATELVAALTRIGIDVCGADRIEIHIDPANDASLRVPRKLGFLEEATLRRRLPANHRVGDFRDEVQFSLLASELADSQSADALVRCCDAAGRPIDPVRGRHGRR
jgi:RimJ/RimL family protein N-acetyltransferase